MKQSFFAFLIILFLIPFCARAQSDATTTDYRGILGGSLNFRFTSTRDFLDGFDFQNPGNNGAVSSRTASFLSIQPYIGKMVSARWLLGLQAGYENGEAFLGSSNSNKYQALSLGVFGRYTLNPSNDFQIFVSPVLEGNRFIPKGTTYRTTQIGLGSNLGLQYSVTERLRLLTNIGGVSVTHATSKGGGQFLNETRQLSVGTNFGLSQLTLGVEWKFGKEE